MGWMMVWHDDRLPCLRCGGASEAAKQFFVGTGCLPLLHVEKAIMRLSFAASIQLGNLS
jgi:hypothetical protein